VVVSGKLITSKAAGTAMEFALRLVGELVSEERMRRLAEEILVECEV